MNGDDVRVAQPGDDLRFPLKPPEVVGVGGERLGQQFEGYVPVTPRVIRLVNFPHRAGTQQVIKPVGSDLLWGHESRPLPKNVTPSRLYKANVRTCLGVQRPARARQ